MSTRPGGDAVYEALRALEVTTVFAVASIHNLPILNAIHRRGGIKVVNMRHEQGALHAADGYFRATGRLGVAFTSTGPGAANAMGGLFEAAFSSSAVLMITGQVETHFLGKGRAFIHEAEQQQAMLRTLTRETWSVRRVEDLADAIIDAAHACFAGRPRPTAVEIPVDVQYADTGIPTPPVRSAAPTRPDPTRLDAAAELLRTAARPLIWAGGGVLSGGAWVELRQLAERLQIPVVTSTQGRGCLPETHPLCLGPLATQGEVRRIVEEADVVLAVGTRFQMYPTDSWRVRLSAQLIHIDVDASVIGRSYPAAVALVSDAKAALAGLDTRVQDTKASPEWSAEARNAAASTRSAAFEAIGPDHAAIVGIIRRHLPADGAVVRDATVPAYYWGDSLLEILEPRTSIHPASAAIGPGLPLALGATIGRNARSVVIHGDGGIMLTIGELAALAQFDVPLTVCVFNDKGYGILRGIEAATFDGPTHDVDLTTPDFVQLGAAMRVPGELVTDVASFEAAFARSVEATGPYLIEVDLTALAPMQISPAAQEILS